MSVLRKEKGWQRRETAATVGAALQLLEEFDRQGPSTKALKLTQVDHNEEEAFSLPIPLSYLGAVGFSGTRGWQSAWNVLPTLDPLVFSQLYGVPLYNRGPDIPRVGWDNSPLYHALHN